MAAYFVSCLLLTLVSLTLAQPRQTKKDTCQLTITVDAQQIQGICQSPQPPQGLLNQEVQNLKQENMKLQEDLTEMRNEYEAMVETVKKLNEETASWREIVEWPLLDAVFRPDNSTMYINPDGPTYEDCTSAVASKRKQGIYSLKPEDVQYPFPAYCDEDGWTVIQRRFDGSENFFRGWDDYMKGFGQLGGEFWLGLENIHFIANQSAYELRVEALGYNGKLYYSVNPDFRIMGEKDEYVFHVGPMTDGNYKDVMSDLKGAAFTAKDNDNDDWYHKNCANEYRGGFWLRNCGFDLNREYCKGQGCMTFGDRNVKKTLMKIRPMGNSGPPPSRANKPKKPKKPKQPRNGRPGRG